MLVVLEGRIEDDLKPIDGLCSRWAVELWDWPAGMKNPIYRGMREREGAVQPSGPPIVADDVMLLDNVLAQSDPRYFALVTVWYLNSRESVAVKAKKLHTNRTDLYHRWRRTLEYLRGRLHGLGLEI